jgi:hypothetical protein
MTTTKIQQKVGQELNTDYLITGNVDSLISETNLFVAAMQENETDELKLVVPAEEKDEQYRYVATRPSGSTESQQQKRQKKRSAPPSPPKSRSSLKMVHVWSPYVVRVRSSKDKNNIFYPLDQAQNVTWESMYLAQQNFNRNNEVHVTIYCAVLWMDVEILERHNPPLCQRDNMIFLNRSTLTEYPDLVPPIHFPFLQDIFQIPTSDYDFFIYTNADIALVELFYTLIHHTLKIYSLDAFTVNRRTIAKEYNNQTLHSKNISFIEKQILPLYKRHPGTDCFIIRREIIQGLNLGNLFLGHPPWARVLLSILDLHMAKRFRKLKSRNGWTYHLGDDRDWKIPKKELVHNHTVSETQFLQQCRFQNKPVNNAYTDHWFQNTLACAEISVGWDKFNRGKGPPPPLVVQPQGVDLYDQVASSRGHRGDRENRISKARANLDKMRERREKLRNGSGEPGQLTTDEQN